MTAESSWRGYRLLFPNRSARKSTQPTKAAAIARICQSFIYFGSTINMERRMLKSIAASGVVRKHWTTQFATANPILKMKTQPNTNALRRKSRHTEYTDHSKSTFKRNAYGCCAGNKMPPITDFVLRHSVATVNRAAISNRYKEGRMDLRMVHSPVCQNI